MPIAKRSQSPKKQQKAKVVIITGASSGIGREAAAYFAKRGWKVVLNGRNEQNLNATVEECHEAGAKDSDVASVAGDITSPTTAQQLIKTALDTFGRIDSLINNAGYGSPLKKFEDAPIEEFDDVIDTNVRSVIRLTKLAIPHIIASKGTIVNISSVVALTSSPGTGYYSMSKAALDQFTKILAVELAPNGVRVNSVNPAMIETKFLKNMGTTSDEEKQYLEHAKKSHALGRTGRVDEVAKAIFFLAGSDSSFTTGELMKVDGGFCLMRP